MYIHLTDRCNMKCPHCAHSCEPGKGKDISLELFEKALTLGAHFSRGVTLGGGEPTLHPEFRQMLRLASDPSFEFDSVEVITNGSNEKITLDLLAESEDYDLYPALIVAVSGDPYHDRSMLSDAVIDRVDDLAAWHTLKPEEGILPAGRGKKLVKAGKVAGNDGCICPVITTWVDGEVTSCGCPGSVAYLNLRDYTVQDAISIIEDRFLRPGWCGRKWLEDGRKKRA